MNVRTLYKVLLIMVLNNNKLSNGRRTEDGCGLNRNRKLE